MNRADRGAARPARPLARAARTGPTTAAPAASRRPASSCAAAAAARRRRPSAARSSATSAPTSRPPTPPGRAAILVPTARTLRDEIDAAPRGRPRPAEAVGRPAARVVPAMTHVARRPPGQRRRRAARRARGPGRRGRRRPGDPAVRPARARPPPSCCPASTRCSSIRPVDRRRARAGRPRRDSRALVGGCRARSASTRAVDPRPRSTRARCRSRCCCGWPASPRIARDQRRLPRLAARLPPPRSRRRARGRARRSSSSRRSGFDAAAGRRRARSRVRRRRRRGRAGAPYVVVHPGASRPRPRAGRPSATRRSSRRSPRRAPGGRHRRPGRARRSRALVAGDRGVIDLGGVTSLGRARRACSRGADASSSATPGPAHLAAAVGTPVVSLFAPTVPAVRWRPWRVPTSCCTSTSPCAGCRARDVPGRRATPAWTACDGRRRCSTRVERLAPVARRSPHEGPALARARLVDDGVRPGRARRTWSRSCPIAAPTAAAAPQTWEWPASRRRGARPRQLARRGRRRRRPAAPARARSWPSVARRPAAGRDVPAVYLEHNAPQGRIADMRHPAADRATSSLVHVTHFNDAVLGRGTTPTRVIEHGIVDPGYALHAASSPRAAVVINEARAPRARDRDRPARRASPRRRRSTCSAWTRRATLGRASRTCPRTELHDEMARRRVYLHPIRWTSLGPVAASRRCTSACRSSRSATTEAPEAVRAEAGVVSTRVDVLARRAARGSSPTRRGRARRASRRARARARALRAGRGSSPTGTRCCEEVAA